MGKILAGPPEEVIQQLADMVSETREACLLLAETVQKLKSQMSAHHFVIHKVLLVELGHRIDLTKEDWNKRLDHATGFVSGLLDKATSDRDKAEYAGLLAEMESFRAHVPQAPESPFRVVPGGKADD